MTPEEMSNHVAHWCADAREILAPVEEASLGYRAHLIEQGWATSSAETMSVEFFKMVLRAMGHG